VRERSGRDRGQTQRERERERERESKAYAVVVGSGEGGKGLLVLSGALWCCSSWLVAALCLKDQNTKEEDLDCTIYCCCCSSPQ
jgi:hypothetical protein